MADSEKDMKMKTNTPNRRRDVVMVVVSVFVMSAAVVSLMAVYIVNRPGPVDRCPSCENPTSTLNTPETFYIEVPKYEKSNVSYVQEYVSVDKANHLEYVVLKDPVQKHTTYVITIDHTQDVAYVFGSEIAQCLIFPGLFRTIEESLEYLEANNNTKIPVTTDFKDFTRDRRETSMSNIPPQMAVLCNPSNTYWMKRTDKDTRVSTSAGIRQCVCYHSCWCELCDVTGCLGQCSWGCICCCHPCPCSGSGGGGLFYGQIRA